MAYVPTSLYVGAPTSLTSTLYTGPGGGSIIIVKEITLTNTTTTAKQINIWFVPNSGSPDNTNLVVGNVSVTPGSPIILAMSSVLGQNDTIQGNGTSIAVRISGVVGP